MKILAGFIIIFSCSSGIIHYTQQRSIIVKPSHNFAFENGLSSTDLKPYKIATPNNKLPHLLNAPTFSLPQNQWLVLDGAEAAFPVYSALANSTYQNIAEFPQEEIDKYVDFNNTIYGFKNLITNQSDIFFGAQPSSEQKRLAEEQHIELQLTPIAREAFIFFVSPDNPLDSLTIEQIRQIYSGQIKNWQQLGGFNKPILPFQRPKNSGSQTILEHMMGQTPIVTPLKNEYIGDMGGITTSVAAYNGAQGAIGYSFRFFLHSMAENKQVKILRINGVAPTAANIANGSYPLTTQLYAITRKNDSRPEVHNFLQWTVSQQGQELIEKVGYVPLH